MHHWRCRCCESAGWVTDCAAVRLSCPSPTRRYERDHLADADVAEPLGEQFASEPVVGAVLKWGLELVPEGDAGDVRTVDGYRVKTVENVIELLADVSRSASPQSGRHAVLAHSTQLLGALPALMGTSAAAAQLWRGGSFVFDFARLLRTLISSPDARFAAALDVHPAASTVRCTLRQRRRARDLRPALQLAEKTLAVLPTLLPAEPEV